MSYEHNVFISYAHGDLWTPWVRDKFVHHLRAYLEIEVGSPEVFVDDQIQTGAHWEAFLKRKVACSKLMLCLLSANYFHREWCRREMALMFEREKSLGIEGENENYGLIIPVRLGDGHAFPDLIRGVQHHDFEQFADPDLPRGTERASLFNQSMRKLAKTIACTLPRAPLYCEDWQLFTGDAFVTELAAKPLATPAPPRMNV